MNTMRQEIVARCKFYRQGKHDALLSLLDDTRLYRLDMPEARINTVTTVEIPLVTVYNFDALHELLIGEYHDVTDFDEASLSRDECERIYKKLLRAIMNKDQYPNILPHLKPENDIYDVVDTDIESYFANAKKVCDVMYEIGMNGEWSEKDGWKIIYKAEIEW